MTRQVEDAKRFKLGSYTLTLFKGPLRAPDPCPPAVVDTCPECGGAMPANGGTKRIYHGKLRYRKCSKCGYAATTLELPYKGKPGRRKHSWTDLVDGLRRGRVNRPVRQDG